MSPLTFFFPVLDALGDGRIIRRSIALALRVLGVLAALAGLVGVIVIVKKGFDRSAPTEMTIGALLLSLLVLAGAACASQICFYRGHSVSELGDSPFTVIPIVSILFRWLGEVYAVMLVALGLGGCIFIWVANVTPEGILGSLAGLAPAFHPALSSSFLAGLAWLVYLSLLAFLALVLAYFLAESTLVLVDMARNMRALVGPPAAASAVAGGGPSAPRPATPPAGVVLLCRSCGAPLEAGSPVCGNCGAQA